MAQHEFSLFRSIGKRLRTPLIIFIPLLILTFVLPLLNLPNRAHHIAERLLGILLTVAFGYILIGFVNVGRDFVFYAFDLSKTNNLKERKIRTQLQFVRKLLITLIAVLTVCAVLLSFESLRKIGTGLLTGVGIGGIIIGLAAQRSLGNLLAGFQIAFTQPIRIDDVLIVEKEWGRVEEITLTYVVLNIWDQRRLILPINYFIEKPFQNWTRTTAELLGTVFLYLDHTAPINKIREEFQRLIQKTPLWDKRVAAVQVTDMKPSCIEIRVLVSAQTSGEAFDLRCYLRENLINFIQKNYPECLPKTRVEGPFLPGEQ